MIRSTPTTGRICWVHVGMHKTASTSIQLSLASNPPDNWEYVTIGRYKNLGQPFFAMFDSNPLRYHRFKKRGETVITLKAKAKKYFKSLERKIAESNASNFLISGETISLIDEPGIERMRDYLSQFFDQIFIIGYVRPPKQFTSSMLQQSIKHGRKKISAKKVSLDYRNRFEKFDRVFSKQNVFLYKFDKTKFTEGCAVKHFCHLIHWPTDGLEVKNTNESLSREAVGILLAYRKYGTGYGSGSSAFRENRKIIDPLFQLPGKPFVLGEPLLNRVVAQYSDHIAWMEKRLGEDLSESVKHEYGVNEIYLLNNISYQDFTRFADLFEASSRNKIDRPKPTGETIRPEEVAQWIDKHRNKMSILELVLDSIKHLLKP